MKKTRTIRTMMIDTLLRRKHIQQGLMAGGALVLILLCTGLTSKAQLQRFPVKRSTGPAVVAKKETPAGRTKQIELLTLPFWDDFSTPYRRLYPDPILWDSSFTVWVNDGLGINAPTINVATFDGIDSAGRSYSEEVMLNGFTDSLVSNAINLSATGKDSVAVSQRDSVYLSFFYQWQGNGEPPDPSDYLQLEFRNNSGKWEKILTIKPKASFQRDVFYDTIIQVTGDPFLHDAFQFRFKAFGRQSGPYDTWNIDYVYLNKGRHINDLSFPERAAASSISPLFKPYTAVPYRHFIVNKKLDSVVFDVQNLENGPASTNYKAVAAYVNYVDGMPITFSRTLIASGGVKGIGGDLEKYERVSVKLSNLPDVNNPVEFDPDADSLDITLKMKVISNDSTEANRFDFDPINLQVNDTISSTYHLGDYYAYDDGHAEYAAGLIGAGNLIAYEFEMLGLSQDTLIGFDIYFPPYGITSNQTVDFTIYKDDPLNPGFPNKERPDNLLNIPSIPIQRKGIDTLQRIQLLPAILITQSKFYIGWKEPVAGNLLVGLDISNDTGDRIFVNTNGFWYKNNIVTGSLMIRPVFGSGTVDVKTGVEKELNVSVYPNPNTGSFLIEGEVDRVEILSITGQKVPFQTEHQPGKTFVRFSEPPGLYILRCSAGNATRTYKIIVSR